MGRPDQLIPIALTTPTLSVDALERTVAGIGSAAARAVSRTETAWRPPKQGEFPAISSGNWPVCADEPEGEVGQQVPPATASWSCLLGRARGTTRAGPPRFRPPQPGAKLSRSHSRPRGHGKPEGDASRLRPTGRRPVDVETIPTG